jgi:transmembrane sensor
VTIRDDEDADMKGSRHDRASQREAKQARSSEAAEWFIRLRDENLPARHRARNVRWLKESPENIAELLRIQQVYALLRECKVQNRTPPAAESPSDDASNVIELVPRAPRHDEFAEVPRRWSARWKVAALAACLMVVVLLGLVARALWPGTTFQTELGEWRTVVLMDGTQVRIGPDSLLRVKYGADHRTAQLLRGEARFTVARDPARPFFVQSEMIGVLAVGTEFRVSRLGGKDVVTVTEGKVAVYPDARNAVKEVLPLRLGEASGAVPVAAGERVAMSLASRSARRGKQLDKQKINVDHELAWADGWLVYENMTVAEIAAEFNRRNRIKIEVAAPSIGERRLRLFRGRATDPESFVAALATSGDIVIVRNDPDVLRLELDSPRRT